MSGVPCNDVVIVGLGKIKLSLECFLEQLAYCDLRFQDVRRLLAILDQLDVEVVEMRQFLMKFIVR